MTDARDDTGHAQPTELRDSNPNAGGPGRAEGEMGISSERVGPTGGGEDSTDGERDTTAARQTDQADDVIGSDAEGEGGGEVEPEENPDGIPPKAGYPSLDPRSEDAPYKDAE
jgi:hypothetical protein